MSELHDTQTVVPLGGDTDPTYLAERAPSGRINAVFPGSYGSERKKAPEKRRKKRSPIAVFFGVLCGIVVMLVVAAVVFILLLTAGDLPDRTGQPEPVDVSNVAVSLFGESEFYLNSGNADWLLDKARTNINASLDKSADSIPVNQLRIDDLYATLGSSSGNMYAHVKFRALGINFTLPVQMKFRVGLEGESAVIFIDYIRIGAVSMPFSIIETVINSGKLPPELSAKNHKIYYNLSTLNDKIDGIVKEYVTQMIDQQVQNNPLLSLIDGFFVDSSLGEFAGQAAANAIDVNIASLGIKDGKLSVTGTVLK